MWWPTQLPPLPPVQPTPSNRLPPVARTTWGRKAPKVQQAEDCTNSAENQPCPQTEAGIHLQKARKTGPTIPKPAPRQLPHEAIPAEYPDTGIRGLPGRASRRGVVRINNRKQEPSLAVKISLKATELPSEIWLGATPFTVQAFAAPVRRCTKCQTLGHSMQQCCAKQTRCCKCGKGSHSHEKCDADVFSCVKRNGRHSAAYKGCTEMQIRQRAKEQDLHPLQRRHAEGPRRNETEGSAPCTACLRRSGHLLVARPDSTALALCGHWNSGVVGEGSSDGRHGQQGAQQEEPHQPTPGTELSGSGGSPRRETPVCGKRRPLWGSDHPTRPHRSAHPLGETDHQSAGVQPSDDPGVTWRSGGLPDGGRHQVEDSPKTNKKRRRRKKKSTKGVEKQADLQYQLVLEQQTNQALEKKIQEQTTKTDGLTTELAKLMNDSNVDLLQETPSFDGFLWKLMLGLIQAKLSGYCAPFLRTITALYNGMTGHLTVNTVCSDCIYYMLYRPPT